MAKLKTRDGVKEHKVVSEKEWVKARKQLLVKEKKFSKARDGLTSTRPAAVSTMLIPTSVVECCPSRWEPATIST